MAVKGGRPAEKRSKNYGPGSHEANPWNAGHEYFRGEKKTIESCNGSIYRGAPISNSNVMDERLDRKGGKI